MHLKIIHFSLDDANIKQIRQNKHPVPVFCSVFNPKRAILTQNFVFLTGFTVFYGRSAIYWQDTII